MQYTMMTIVKRAILVSFILACQTRIGLSIKDLTGFSYKCGGLNIGFDGDSKIFCGGTAATAYDCGTYEILNQNAIVGKIKTASQQIQWIAQDITEHDDILVSFTMDYVEDDEDIESVLPSLDDISKIDAGSRTQLTCYVTSKSWRKFDAEPYGVTCPVAPNQGEKHVLEFGRTGDVSFRTELTVHGGTQTPADSSSSPPPHLTRDFYGVYTWTRDGALRMYFGPQSGRTEMHVRNGRMTHQGFVYLDGLSLPGPCVAAGDNYVSVLKDLPREGGMAGAYSETSGAGASWSVVGSGLLMTTAFFFGMMV